MRALQQAQDKLREAIFAGKEIASSPLAPAQKQNPFASVVRSWIPGLALRARNDGPGVFVIPAQAGIQAHTDGCPFLWEGRTGCSPCFCRHAERPALWTSRNDIYSPVFRHTLRAYPNNHLTGCWNRRVSCFDRLSANGKSSAFTPQPVRPEPFDLAQNRLVEG